MSFSDVCVLGGHCHVTKGGMEGSVRSTQILVGCLRRE